MSDADPPVLDEGVLSEVLESTGDDIGFVRSSSRPTWTIRRRSSRR